MEYGRCKINFKGFTLIEILIVLLIMGIVAATATLTIRFNKNKEYEAVAKTLLHLFQLAEDEALLRPATIGIKIRNNKVQFLILMGEKKWAPLRTPPLTEYAVAPTVKISIQTQLENDNEAPQIIILPDRTLNPFSLYIGPDGGTAVYKMIGKESGEMTIQHV